MEDEEKRRQRNELNKNNMHVKRLNQTEQEKRAANEASRIRVRKNRETEYPEKQEQRLENVKLGMQKYRRELTPIQKRREIQMH